MWKSYSLRFDSKSDRPETSAEMTLRLTVVGIVHQEETVFEVVNLNAVNFLKTKSFKDVPSMKIKTDSSQDNVLKPMSNDYIEFTRRLVTSQKECFS